MSQHNHYAFYYYIAIHNNNVFDDFFCIYFNSLITTSRVFFPILSSSLNEWAILFYSVSVEYKKILRTDSGL